MKSCGRFSWLYPAWVRLSILRNLFSFSFLPSWGSCRVSGGHSFSGDNLPCANKHGVGVVLVYDWEWQSQVNSKGFILKLNCYRYSFENLYRSYPVSILLIEPCSLDWSEPVQNLETFLMPVAFNILTNTKDELFRWSVSTSLIYEYLLSDEMIWDN